MASGKVERPQANKLLRARRPQDKPSPAALHLNDELALQTHGGSSGSCSSGWIPGGSGGRWRSLGVAAGFLHEQISPQGKQILGPDGREGCPAAAPLPSPRSSAAPYLLSVAPAPSLLWSVRCKTAAFRRPHLLRAQDPAKRPVQEAP